MLSNTNPSSSYYLFHSTFPYGGRRKQIRWVQNSQPIPGRSLTLKLDRWVRPLWTKSSDLDFVIEIMYRICTVGMKRVERGEEGKKERISSSIFGEWKGSG